MSAEFQTILNRASNILTCPIHGSVRIATEHDIENLFTLINKAYDEEYFKYHRDGFNKRLQSNDQVVNYMNKGIFFVLQAFESDDANTPIVACIFLNYEPANEIPEKITLNKVLGQINLLSVHPTMRKRGIGRYMMRFIEVFCKELHYTHVLLGVISIHQHLVHMYAKLNYEITGTMTWEDLQMSPETMIIPTHFIVMEKALL